jgi:hypothetical protein
LFEHIDVDINKVLLVPFQSAHHWSLLVLIFDGMHLYSVDSGRTKLFAHNDLQYAPAIAILEKVLKLRCKTITRSPTRLDCTIQPNSYDCGYHTVLNAMSISDYIINDDDDANGCLVLNLDLLAWTPPTSTPLEVRVYRKELHEKIDALPYADSAPIVTAPTNAEPSDSDDEPLQRRGLGASTSYTERDFST